MALALTAKNELVINTGRHIQEAETRIGRFANNMQTAMEHIKRQVENATRSVNALKSAVDSLKSKTITIKVNYKESGRPSFNASGGFSVVGVTKVDNAIFGEAGPEALIGIPLDKGGRLSSPAPVLGGGSNQPISIHNHLEVDGREIARNQDIFQIDLMFRPNYLFHQYLYLKFFHNFLYHLDQTFQLYLDLGK